MAALTTGLNWGSAVLIVGWLAIDARRMKRDQARHWFRVNLAISLGLLGLIYESLPTIQVRLENAVYWETERNLEVLAHVCGPDSTNSATCAGISASAKNWLTPTNGYERGFPDSPWINWDNHYLGGRIHEEDSPGNYSLRENGDQIEFVVCDAQGAGHVEQSWPLRPPESP
jgi:hypothetical protein